MWSIIILLALAIGIIIREESRAGEKRLDEWLHRNDRTKK
jgi:hypothetical protein